MGLGRREARHQTVAAARTAGVDPSAYWEYKPGQKVMTRDGYPGKVLAVHDGPFAGNEEYEVVLDHGLGGGSYTASLLQPFNKVESKVDVKTAADDYPELGTILEDRPPLARAVTGSLVEAKDTQADHDRDAMACETCNGSGEIPDDDAGHNHRNDDPDYPNKACPDCEGSGHKTASKTAAYNEGDPDKYTSSHKCPECGSERALESAEGTIKCEDCGHLEDNGDQDGYGGRRMASLDDYDFLVTAAADSDFRDSFISHGEDDTITQRGQGQVGLAGREAALGLSAVDGDTRRASSTDRLGSGTERSAVPGGLGGRDRTGAAEGVASAPSVRATSLHRGDASGTVDYRGAHAATRSGADNLSTGAWARGVAHATGRQEVLPSVRASESATSEPEDIYGFLTEAAVDSEMRFHVTATFADVRNKAKRLRAEGGVNIISATAGTVAANVKGDHHVYETVLSRQPGKQAVAQWACGCKWAAYSWGRTGNYKRFEGRMCSHALALQYEAQSRGMFGKQVDEDQKAPQWLKPRTRVVVEYDRDSGKNQSRPAQPRKRDLERTYATVDASVAPVTLLCMLAVAQGASYDDLSLALESAGINATAFLIESKDLPASDQDKAKHRHKGDQTPCARAGCGHPDGIHGDNGATCLSQGCDCKKFTTSATDNAQTEATDDGGHKFKSKESRRKHHTDHHGLHGGEYPMRGGFGYGYGYLPYYADYDGGHEGAEDEGGGSDADDGGGMGSTGSLKTADTGSPYEGTMDPTYTEGNDIRPNPNGNGLWNATKPPNPNDNPGSTGWAATGDPKEFNSANANDAAGRLGSLNVQSVFEGLPPVEAGAEPLPDGYYDPAQPPQPKVPATQRAQQRWNQQPAEPEPAPAPAEPAVPAVRHLRPVQNVSEPAAPKPAAPAAPKPSGGGIWDDIKGAAGDVGKTVGDVAGEVGPAAGEAASAGAKELGPEAAAASTLVSPLVHQITHPGDWAGSGKALWNGLTQPIVPGTPKTEAPYKTIGDAGKAVYHGAEDAFNWVHDHTPAQNINNGIHHAWDSLFGGGDSKPSTPKPAAPAPAAAPHPQVFAPTQQPAWAPAKVPAAPGHAAPGVAPVLVPHPQPGLAPAPAPAAGTAPHSIGHSSPSNQPLTPPKPASPSEPKDEGGDGGKWPKIPPLPGFWNPDYYRESNTLMGQGIGSMSSLMDAQTQARTALAALLAEGDLHDKPEPALPSTDGADLNMDEDPDGDVQGMQVQGSLDDPEVVDEGAVADIVARFQATAGASSLMSGSSALPEEGGDVAAMAKAFLQTEAMKTFTPGEQRQIIDEGKDVTASNLDRLKIEGTHYEALEAALASSDNDDDGDLWS